MAFRIGMYISAAVLLAAHFLRAGNLVLVALCLAAPLLFLYQKRGTLIVLQVLAYCAAGTWITVAVQLVRLRQQSGQAWTVTAMILATVAVFTSLAGLLLNSRAIKEHYRD